MLTKFEVFFSDCDSVSAEVTNFIEEDHKCSMKNFTAESPQYIQYFGISEYGENI